LFVFQADNPDTLEEFFDRIEKEDNDNCKSQAEFEKQNLARAEAGHFEEEPYNSEDDEDGWETDDNEDEEDAEFDSKGNLSTEEGSTLQSDPELFKSEDEDGSQNSGSPELFTSPRNSRAPGPQPRKVGGGKEFRNMITPLVGLRFPSSKQSVR